MRTQKRAASAPKTTVGIPEAPQPPVEIPSAEEKDKGTRISFNLTPDGVPDWDRMQAKTKGQITELLKNKSVQKQLGFSPEESAKKIEELEFGDDEVNALLDGLGKINAMGASFVYKIPGEVTAEAFEFTPEHRKKLTPGTKRLLNKWGPQILKTWKDEIGVSIVFLSVLNSQVRTMHFLENRRKRAAAQTPSQPTPIRVAPSPAPESAPAPEPAKAVDEKQPKDILDGADIASAIAAGD